MVVSIHFAFLDLAHTTTYPLDKLLGQTKSRRVMKSVFNLFLLLATGLLLAACASDRELRKLESAYQAQLGEYATALKSGEITKAEHDKKVTQLNSRYGRRREMMERDIYGNGIKSPRRRPTIGRGGRRY